MPFKRLLYLFWTAALRLGPVGNQTGLFAAEVNLLPILTNTMVAGCSVRRIFEKGGGRKFENNEDGK